MAVYKYSDAKNTKIVGISLILIILFACNPVFAAKKNQTQRAKRIFPHGCRVLGHTFENGLLIFTPSNKSDENVEAQTLYLINNKSNDNVTFKIKKLPDQTFSPSYENTISRYAWGAFALNQKKMQFTCTLASGASAGEDVDCAQVAQVCEYNNVKFSDSNEGTYWIAKSDSQRSAMQKAIDSGILLRW